MLAQETAAHRAPPAAREATEAPLSALFTAVGARMQFARNSEIYGEGEPAEYFYKVVKGAVRTYKLLSDGRRQIGAFQLPGDFFGLEGGDEHRFSAEAVSDATVLLVRRSLVTSEADRDAGIARELWRLTASGLDRAHEHMLVLGRKTAQERIAAFLVDMARREKTAALIELPMSRLDIADYLGLTIETVSRTLTQLENSAAIELPSSRRVVLRNRVTLDRLNA